MSPTEEKAMQRAWCEYRNQEYVEGYVNPLPSENFEKGYEFGRRDALPSQWHFVKESGLPPCENDVFVAYKSRYTDSIMYGVACYDSGVWYTEDDTISTSNILAWMYIPKLSKPDHK